MTRQLVHVGKKIQVFVETTPLPQGGEIKRDIVVHPGLSRFCRS